MSLATSGVACVIVDGHPAILRALERYLGEEGLDVVGTADNADDALALIGAKRPPVAVVDFKIAPVDGNELARRAVAVSPQTAVVISSSSTAASATPGSSTRRPRRACAASC